MDVLTHGFAEFIESSEWECDGTTPETSGFLPRCSDRAHEQQDTPCRHISLVQPVLQLIDIQRDNRGAATDAHDDKKECYNVAMSDGERALWCAIPRKSAICDYIANFELEVGCCLTVQRYTVARSPLGVHIPILLLATFIPNPVPLIGFPNIDYDALQLSPLALRKDIFNSSKAAATEGRDALSDPAPVMLPLSEVHLTRDAWSIRVRILWKGRLRRYVRRVHSSNDNMKRNVQFEMEAVVVDREGCCVTAVFSGDETIASAFGVGECVELAGGKVRWSSAFSDSTYEASKRDFEAGVPTENAEQAELQWYTLHFGSRSKILKIVDTPELPYEASRELGRPSVCFSSVESVVTSALPGSIVSVDGLVSEVSDRIPTNTKRGRVDRRVVKLCDLNNAEHSVSITLWDELAGSVYAAPGSLWCFRDFYVRIFNQRKTLSSCSSSEAFPKETAVVLRRVLERETRPRHLERLSPCVLEMSPRRREYVYFSLSDVLSFPDGSPSPYNGLPQKHSISDRLVKQSEGRSVLLRVQDVITPLFCFTCPSCGTSNQMNPRCRVCGASTLLCYAIRLIVSDGEAIIEVTGDRNAGVALFGLAVEDFAGFCARNTRFESTAVQELIGQPLLGRLTSTQTSDGHRVQLECCEETSVADCARAALQAVEMLSISYPT